MAAERPIERVAWALAFAQRVPSPAEAFIVVRGLLDFAPP
jgi:hypothetical protein